MPWIGTGEGCRNRAGSSAGRRGRGVTPASDIHGHPLPASRLGDSSLPPPARPPALPLLRPAPCCRTRRWQARWCSCPRTNPPPSCQPADGPTSAGRPWPLWSIGAASPQRRPARAAAGHPVRLPLYAVRDSLRMRRLPAGLPNRTAPARHPRCRPAPAPPPGVPEHDGHAHSGRDLTGRKPRKGGGGSGGCSHRLSSSVLGGKGL